MELFIILWLMCAITAAVIGAGKGRSGFGWFLLGALLGIFAVIMVACLPSRNTAVLTPAGDVQMLTATTARPDYVALALTIGGAFGAVWIFSLIVKILTGT